MKKSIYKVLHSLVDEQIDLLCIFYTCQLLQVKDAPWAAVFGSPILEGEKFRDDLVFQEVFP